MKKILFYLMVLFTLTFSAFSVKGQVLDVPETIQEHSMWCWDASSVCILNWYGFLFTQCEIANWAFSRSDCCGEPVFDWKDLPDHPELRHPCNSGSYLSGHSDHDIDDVLAHYGSLASSLQEGALTKAEVITEMGEKTPFVMRFDWTGGGAHALVGHGISGDDVYYMDPWPGNGFTISDYDFVVHTAGHDWTRTLKLTTLPGGNDFYLMNAALLSQSCTNPGGLVNVSCEVHYVGSTADADLASVRLGYYLSADLDFDPGSDVLLGTDYSSLGTDVRVSSEEAILTIPLATAGGNYYIIFVADDNAQFTESNEDNNKASISVRVDDIAPTLTCSPDAVRPADPEACTYEVTGTGFASTATDNGTVTSHTWVMSGATEGSGENSIEGQVLNRGVTTVDWTATDECGNISTCQQEITVEDTQPPILTCKPNAVKSSDEGECTYSAVGTEFDATSTDNCEVESIIWELTGATEGTGSTTLDGVEFNFGLTTVTWTAEDPSENSSSCQMEINVNKIITITTVSTDLDEQEYSDPVEFTATIQPGSCTGAGQAATHVTFYVGDQPMGDPVPLVLDGGILSASETYPLLDYPGFEGTMDPDPLKNPKTVTAKFSGIDEDFEVNDATSDLTVIPENACAYYAGVYYASTGSPLLDKATVILAVTIVEEDDGYPGAFLNNTMVRFYDDGFLIASIPALNAGEIGAGPAIGTASYEWTGVDVYVYDITVEVLGYYSNAGLEDCDGEALVTVGQPSPEFITGGGYVTLENSMGLLAGTQDTKNNFGFIVKYNKKLTNLQGNLNTIVRRIEADGMHLYKIKSNALSSLAVEENQATFTGKASIQDITDPLNVIDVTGGCILQFTLTDNGEPGTSDLISITVWKNAGLWFTMSWDEVNYRPAEQLLDGGNLVVHSGTDGGTKPPKKKIGTIDAEESSTLQVYPNPFSERLIFDFTPPADLHALLEVFDATGRKLETLLNHEVTDGVTYKIEYRPQNAETRLLFYRLILGDQIFVGKVVYQQ